MAMFGALGRKKGPFDMAGDFPGTPGIGDGLPQNQQYDPGMGSITPAPEKKGVDWGRIAGIVSDGLAGAIGQPGQYAAGLRQQKEREYERQQYQQQLADRWGLWKQQQDYENAHKAPVYTDLQKNMIAAGIQPGSAEWIKASRGAVQNTSDPIVNANVGGRDFFGPRSLLLDNIGNGGGQESPSPGGGATGSPPASGGFMNLQQFKSMQAAPSFKPGHPAWATPVQISSDAEYDQLPAGKTFIGPDGQVRTKQ